MTTKQPECPAQTVTDNRLPSIALLGSVVRFSTPRKPKLAVSFSGGRTSAVMTKLLWEQYRETHELAVCFANTGCEHPATLDFVDACDKHFGWGVVWLEAVVTHGERVGIRHKVVSYETAARKGEPFEEYIKKHGLPGPTHPHCTSRLKEEVMDSYRHRELGWEKGEYWTAIGIRADEMDRVSEKRLEKRFVYPLVKSGWRKNDIAKEIESWPFDLQLPGDHLGNCTWCWKKSIRKLLTVAAQHPRELDFPERMEAEHAGIDNAGTGSGERFFFRDRRRVADLRRMAADGGFVPYSDAAREQGLFDFAGAGYDLELDTGSACGESCEIGADD